MTALFSMTGAKLSLCGFYGQLAQGYLLTGETPEALQKIDEAIAMSAMNGNVFNLTEIHRLRGEILLARASDRVADAEACFIKSL